MKSKKGIFFLLLIFCSFFMFSALQNAYAIFDINPTVRIGNVLINEENVGIDRYATFNGNLYIPLNLAASYIKMSYTSNNGVEVFAYKNNVLKIDFNKKSVIFNDKPYTLLYGVSRKTVKEIPHTFLNCKDIQNIFGLLCFYDKENGIIDINTGFGVLEVDYVRDVGYQTNDNINKSKIKLLKFGNEIASKLKGTMEKVNKKEVEAAVNGIFNSINSPITSGEYKDGIIVNNVSAKNAKSQTITYFKKAKILSGFSNVYMYPEYVDVYKISNQSKEMYLVGLFIEYEGLDVSDEDLADAAVATMEDALNKSLSEKNIKELKTKIKEIANSSRKNTKMVILVITGNEISIVDLL